MGDLGPPSSWLRDGAVGAGALVFSCLMLIVVIDSQLDPGRFWLEMSRLDNLSRASIAIFYGAFSGGLLATMLHLPVVASHRFHPGMAWLLGPLWGAGTAMLTAAFSIATTQSPSELTSISWGVVAFLGSGSVLFAWPIYVALRSRGRGGWPALFVAVLTQPVSLGLFVLARSL